jgi:DNA-binding transcriptional ArsR family regulator
MVEQTSLDRLFHALAHDARRDMLDRLAAEDLTVGALAEPFAMSFAGASKHVKVLERAGLIERDRQGQARPSRLRGHALDDAAAWIEIRKRTWDARMDRLDAHLRQQRTAP